MRYRGGMMMDAQHIHVLWCTVLMIMMVMVVVVVGGGGSYDLTIDL